MKMFKTQDISFKQAEARANITGDTHVVVFHDGYYHVISLDSVDECFPMCNREIIFTTNNEDIIERFKQDGFGVARHFVGEYTLMLHAETHDKIRVYWNGRLWMYV